MSTKDYKVLVPTDFSDQSDSALHEAIHLASIVDGEVVLLYVLQEKKGILGKFFNSQQQESFEELVKEKLNEQALDISKNHNVKVECFLKYSTSVQSEIINFADEIKASIIVMGKGAIIEDGVEKPSIGSITSRILRLSKIPVITIGGGDCTLGFKNILLPLDLTKETRQKVSWAINYAKLFGADIQVVSAIWEETDFVVNQINAQMNQVVSFIKKQNINVKGEIIRPTDGSKNLISILSKYMEEHKEFDLVMIMTQQEDDFTKLFVGSAASSFIRESKIPVMSIVPRKLDDIVVGF